MNRKELIAGLKQQVAEIDAKIASLQEQRNSALLALEGFGASSKTRAAGNVACVVRKNNKYPKQVRQMILEYLNGAPKSSSYDEQELTEGIMEIFMLPKETDRDQLLKSIGSRMSDLEREQLIDVIKVGPRNRRIVSINAAGRKVVKGK